MKNLILLGILLLELAIFLAADVRDLPAEYVGEYLAVYAGDLLTQSGRIVFLAFGMTLVLMTAGIDLSVASMTVLVASLMATCCGEQFGWHAVPFGLAAGVLLGAFNGVLIASLNMPPIITTLGTLFFFRGLCRVALGEEKSVAFQAPGYGHLGEWPAILVLIACVYGGLGYLFHRSRWRREILLVGGNRVAARYAGISVSWRLVEVYALVGLLAALTAVVFTARNGSVRPDSLEGLELRVIVATVLGGTPVQGGSGSIAGTFLGVLIVTALDEGLRGWAVSGIELPFRVHYLQYLLLGGLLVLGVWLNTRANRQQRSTAVAR